MCGRSRPCAGDGQGPFEVGYALNRQKCLHSVPRGAEDRRGRGVERAMEECDVGPAPTARVGSGAAEVHPAQARANFMAGNTWYSAALMRDWGDS